MSSVPGPSQSEVGPPLKATHQAEALPIPKNTPHPLNASSPTPASSKAGDQTRPINTG